MEKFHTLDPNRKSTIIIVSLYAFCIIVGAIPWIILAFRDSQWDETAMNIKSIGVIAFFASVIIPSCLINFIRKRCRKYYEEHLPPEEIERRKQEAERQKRIHQECSQKHEDEMTELRKTEIETKTDSERIYELEKQIKNLTHNSDITKQLLERLSGIPFGYALIFLVITAIISCNGISNISKKSDAISEKIETIESNQKRLEYDIDKMRNKLKDIEYEIKALKSDK
ncbi:hypothetical protein [Fibrobacter sp. UWB5]|uniref:hypothetical protein n=1 Tax=Fibrobacter sp. UWB5 TaxID=1964360 RepID=UPI000B527B9C|nr:hypothetical protein [Fibrobacter sp. UWB5]OWV13455.1 hypothetical protein B7989_06140 [Fibrobacter sp. UWB5]